MGGGGIIFRNKIITKCVKKQNKNINNNNGSSINNIMKLITTSFQPVLHDWCNKGRGMCNPVCGMVHIKEALLLIGNSSPCGGRGFPSSLYVYSDAI